MGCHQGACQACAPWHQRLCCHPGDNFIPSFPASSPWVTAVGATQRDNRSLEIAETAAIMSAGGFSNYFDMPDYQKDAVSKYFQSEQYLKAVSGGQLPPPE